MPIHDTLPELKETLAKAPVAILSAPPGSGKTTVVPVALLDEAWLAGKKILMLEPRRLAARLAANFMAGQYGEKVGETIGYRVRFENKTGTRTRVEVLTEGLLTRQLQNDPELADVGLVIFDEFHERNLASDLALALCLDAMAGLREDLKILIMSATIDTGELSRTLGGAPVITGQGQSFPVEIFHRDTAGESYPAAIARDTAQGIRKALVEQEGDILAFLPGTGEIRRTMDLLAEEMQANDILLRPLYGDLTLAQQNSAVRPDPQGHRRVILATNIAESSVTIEGIRTVVDSGWKRMARFSPNSGLTRLETTRISRASANQRAGRAGRLSAGCCYRLWDLGVEHSMRPFDSPEILEADLAGLMLELANWGTVDPDQLTWITSPPVGGVGRARELLRELDGLASNNRITEMGKKMATLPLHPRLAHMLIRARETGNDHLACDLAALLSERDIIRGREKTVDMEERIHGLAMFRKGRNTPDSDPSACRRVDQVSRQLRQMLSPKKGQTKTLSPGALLALAFPDRIGGLRQGAKVKYLLTSGRGASLPSHDRLQGQDYIVVPELDAARAEGRIFLAAPVTITEIESLFAEHIRTAEAVVWDSPRQCIEASRQSRLGALILHSHPLKKPASDKLTAALTQGITEMGLDCLPWTDEARNLQNRILFLHRFAPDQDWPDVGDVRLLASLEEWLAPFLAGITTKGQLKQLDMKAILLSMLDWQKQQQLDQEAPPRLAVPSGSKVRLRYPTDGPPVLAVRLQEMFGLADTPRVCNGRVPVMLHLLSPAQRPLQITQDLKGFWDGSYHEVKKEMKGRYPKHYWPDDPWQCAPTRRTKPRKT